MINKADAADPLVVSPAARPRAAQRRGVGAHAARASTRRCAAIEADLPRPRVEFDALLPYERGDLVNRIHQDGEIGSTRAHRRRHARPGRANADLAGELEAYAR